MRSLPPLQPYVLSAVEPLRVPSIDIKRSLVQHLAFEITRRSMATIFRTLDSTSLNVYLVCPLLVYDFNSCAR